jgi:tRNA (cmo5U34)-methyltransferase
MTTPDTASDYFGSLAAEYDSLIRRAVPRYDEMLGRLIEYLPQDPRRVLELGCGTGNLTLAVAGARPDCLITTVDAAEEMVELTRTRLRERVPSAEARATFLTAKFEELEAEPASFDLIVSAISLHHVVDKGALYRSLHGWLIPGGALCFSDQMGGGTRENHDVNWRRWLEHCRLPGNCTEDEIKSLLEHAEAHDHYTPLAEHLALLDDAGFRNLDCVWRDWMWGVVTADA